MSTKSVSWSIAKAGVVAAPVVLFGWAAGLGVLVYWGGKAAIGLYRTRKAIAEGMRCPRGHVVPSYGLFRCAACFGVSESWIWRCGICQSWAGWTACPTCGLAIRNPLLK